MLVLSSGFVAGMSALLRIIGIEELGEIADDSCIVPTPFGHGFPCLCQVFHVDINLSHAVVDLLVDKFQSGNGAGYDLDRIVRLLFQPTNFLLFLFQNVVRNRE